MSDQFAYMPVRIRLDEHDQVVSLHRFDVLTQESSKSHLDSLTLYPNREYSLNPTVLESFRKIAFTVHENPRDLEVYRDIRKGEAHPELASWIALDGRDWVSIPDASPEHDVYFEPDAREAIAQQWHLVQSRHGEIKTDPTRIPAPVSLSWLSPEEVDEQLSGRRHLQLALTGEGSGMKRLGSLNDALALLKSIMAESTAILFVMKSDVRLRHIRVMCSLVGINTKRAENFEAFANNPKGFALLQGDLNEGFYEADRGFRVITELEVFGQSIESAIEEELGEHQRKIILQGLTDIQLGDPVVHALQGVGRFNGFETLNLTGKNEDLLKLGFANDTNTFVRMNDLDMVSRYSGGQPEKAPLSKLNDPSWLKGLNSAQTSAFEVAEQLITLRNARQRSIGVVLEQPGARYVSFCETFAYEETADQKRAIQDILTDLTSGKPMDRLICGDVGFGKTEVAMRAAFMMASQGYQVALLAPTTLLAEQHYQTVLSRFEDTGLTAMLANSKTLSAQQLRDIRNGQVSVVVGTHRILQSDVQFANLGLYVIDEEQRFGVRQKEMLRTMRGNKHVLAMAATPIPRTLGMAISGIRDISIIATPPARRLAVRTLVRPRNNAVLREAISRELSRGGQVYYLHNRIETIDECVAMLQEQAPSARIGRMHGQMAKDEMTQVMMNFRQRQFDILVCTTVIEVGIDVPNANTLLVENAGNLGLAQLHQLRGRVGRSTRQAYAYLLTDDKATALATRRLKAMEKATNLGEGVLLARQDMEIRGIGEILGEDQSGHIHNIGFSLYMRLLEGAIRAIDNGVTMVDASAILNNVKMPITGSLPSKFMPQTGERLTWYQRLMSSDTPSELDRHMAELIDLYGYLPSEALELKESISKYLAAKHWNIASIKEIDMGIKIEAGIQADIDQLATMLTLSFRGKLSGLEKEGDFVVAGHTLDEVVDRIAKSTRWD
jgi:transcription-repair coupling factor (superfamily II helicase)